MKSSTQPPWAVGSICDYNVDPNLTKENGGRAHDDLHTNIIICNPHCTRVSLRCKTKFFINMMKPVKRVSGPGAVGSIRDYYVDPNLTEEDRAVPNSHDGWMDVKVRNSNSRFMIEIVFNTCLPLYL